MTKTSTRFMLTVSNDIAKQAETLKKEIYFDKQPYAEMYRQLIRIGIDAFNVEQPHNPTKNCP